MGFAGASGLGRLAGRFDGLAADIAMGETRIRGWKWALRGVECGRGRRASRLVWMRVERRCRIGVAETKADIAEGMVGTSGWDQRGRGM